MKLYNTNNLKEEHPGVQNSSKNRNESKNRRFKQKGQKIKLNKHLKVEQKTQRDRNREEKVRDKDQLMSPDPHII